MAFSRLPVVSAPHEAPLDAAASPALDRHADECGGCAMVDRRGFLTRASLLGLGAMVTAACGNGILGGPDTFPNIQATPFRVDPRTIPGLAQVGGRAVVSQADSGAVLVERLSATTYRGFSLACPHQGTTVEVVSTGFRCPNHDARFSTEGVWLGGQPTADLLTVPVVLQSDGTLMIGGAAPAPPAVALGVAAVGFLTSLASTTATAPQSVLITNSGGGLLSGLALSLSYAANQPTGWLTIALNQTDAPATVTLTANRGSLAAGNYSATVRVSASNATDASTLTVSLVVQDPNAPPVLQLSTTTAAFTTTIGLSPASQVVQVLNGGGSSLAGLAYTISYGAGATGWLSTSALSAVTAPTSLTLRPTATGLAAGSYTATVQVSGTGVPAKSIAVTLTVVASGLAVTLASYPALANIGGVAGSVGTVNGGQVAVARINATTFAAFSMRCPHAGTTINVVNGTSFRCPNHGALFTNTGALASNSPFRTSSLSPLTVSYTPGATVLYVS